MSKIEENSDNIYKCPCGSGKEPQDCCFKDLSGPPKAPRFPLKNQDLIISDFSKYSQIELISALAGLQIYSKNHSYIPRLTTACQIASSIKKSGTKPVKLDNLRQLFDDYFPAKGEISKREDPPEDLFTENIDFINGNNIVYSGISPDGGHILRILLHSAFSDRDSFSDQSINEVIPPILALLLLSNEVAVRSGHDRYSSSDVQLWGPIKIPGNEELVRLQKAVIFSPEDLYQLFSPYGFDIGVLDRFIIRIGSSDFLKGRIHENPLYSQPIVKIQDKIILVVPAAIVGILRHFIFTQAKKHKKIRQLASTISKSYWFSAQTALDLLGFKPSDIELPPLENMVGFNEGIYSIDSDKVAYVHMVTDVAESYKEIYPLRWLFEKNRMNKINRRYEEVISRLFERNDPRCKFIFFIAVLGGIGRSISIEYSPEPGNVRACVLTSENLEILSRIGDCDALKLWKFVGHFTEVSSYHRIGSFSVLDMYEFYLRSHVPRDVWQEPGPATILISAGTGQRLRIKAAINTDIHAIRSENPPAWISSMRHSMNPSEPIFVPEGTLIHPSGFVVEQYPQPIWINIWAVSGKIYEGDYPFYYQFMEVCSFWIWKMTDSLKVHLVPLGPEPIHIMIGYEKFDENGCIDPEVHESGLRRPSISIDSKKRTIFLIINGTMHEAINEGTNRGERCLVDTILLALGKLLESNSFSNTLEENERAQIVDRYIPFGTTRKLYSIKSSEDPALDPRWVPTVRLLEEHDLKEQFNGYKREMEEFREQSGIASLNEKNISDLYNFCVDIHFARLKNLISEYSWVSLLSITISQHEALIRFLALRDHEATWNLNLYYDLETQVRHYLSERELWDNSSSAVRNLIEIISAEPPNGTKQVSLTDFDTLLACSHMLIHNGTLSDSARFGLFNKLPNRIEEDNPDSPAKTAQDYVEKFYEEKCREAIEAAHERFTIIPEPKSSDKIITDEDFDQELQKAFKSEFGLDLSRIIRFFAFVIDLGLELETASPHLPLSEFRARAKAFLKWADGDIDNAIQRFSLTPRQKYEVPPNGFTQRDIFPWHYNRRISYIARPLIIGPEPIDDPLIFWGPRHVNESWRILTRSVYSGRYRVDDKTAPEMVAFISRIQNEFAKDFEREVATWIKQNTPWIVYPSEPIAPNGKLRSDENLGDIDVLAIDPMDKKIYSIECKMINFGRNPREVLTEIQKFLGETDNDKKSMKRHLKRDTWLKSHVDVICSAYDLPPGDYSVISLFVASEELVTGYIRETPLPIIAFSRLKREGPGFFKTP
jgi:hypothetical protein